MIVARVVNDKGRAFNVRMVRRGDRYGMNDVLVHDQDEPLVEFWDATYEHDPRFTPGLGQFATRYSFDMLTGRNGHGHRSMQGLDLCGHVPEWKITAGNLVDVITAAERALRREATA